ncbi:MAG: hypothetical protein AABW73_02540 [Nanoarchaeota archaeon]
MVNKVKVCLDLDDVLTGFMKGFSDFHNNNHGTSISYDNIKTLNIAKLLGISQDEAWGIVESYYNSADFDSLIPYDGVIRVLEEFTSLGIDLVIVTYRSGTGWKKSHDWLKKHFGSHIKLVHGLDKNGMRLNKGKVCAEQGVSFILEDCLDNAIHCLEEGITPFVLTMPWNIDRELPSGVVRVKDHQEFFQKVSSLIKK